MDNLYIIILASGAGSRVGYKKPKQLIKVRNKPIFLYSVKTAYSLKPKELILTYPKGLKKTFENILDQYKFQIKLVEGGERRQDSVINAINSIKENGIVLIHDSARPLVSRNLFFKVYKSTLKKGNTIPIIPISDTVKEIDNNCILKTLDRSKLFLSQTPQGFKIDSLKSAFTRIPPSLTYTDEANLLEILGEKIFTIPGERYNLKLTFKEDLDIIKYLIEIYESKGWFGD